MANSDAKLRTQIEQSAEYISRRFSFAERDAGPGLIEIAITEITQLLQRLAAAESATVPRQADERDTMIKMLQRGFANLYHMIEGKDCDPLVGIGMATSSLDRLLRQHAAVPRSTIVADELVEECAAVKVHYTDAGYGTGSTHVATTSLPTWAQEAIRALKGRHTLPEVERTRLVETARLQIYEALREFFPALTMDYIPTSQSVLAEDERTQLVEKCAKALTCPLHGDAPQNCDLCVEYKRGAEKIRGLVKACVCGGDEKRIYLELADRPGTERV